MTDRKGVVFFLVLYICTDMQYTILWHIQYQTKNMYILYTKKYKNNNNKNSDDGDDDHDDHDS